MRNINIVGVVSNSSTHTLTNVKPRLDSLFNNNRPLTALLRLWTNCLADFNVIIVNWETGSNGWNYVNAAYGTQTASIKIFRLLLDMRIQMEKQLSHKETHHWNSLYFVGHSLGAHISAQVSHLLSGDNFWQIKRITGLDPAQPCFQHVDFSLKLDHTDAEFVDVIHTQAGNYQTFNFGLREDLGHVDFYVNGGVVQPACIKASEVLEEHICSHKLAYSYFIESISHSLNKDCEFMSFEWDGSQADAMKNFDVMRMNGSCHDCPRMGIDAPVHYSPGKYIVFTGDQAPYCRIEEKGVNKVQAALEVRSYLLFIFNIQSCMYEKSIFEFTGRKKRVTSEALDRFSQRSN
ncbi:hypothetical protein QAD02_008620 [Eretmocerus hayati]|uniref:Uncharacterized protein n=1 Tax=Eretmocerus hayati TaxID=131215 RepID=A0ACC2N7L6_9HYME|nr:hypothetical protein QAD02_008620 [Eretmocerus hayati]